MTSFGRVISVRGSLARVGLLAASRMAVSEVRATVGRFISIRCASSTIVAMITDVSCEDLPSSDNYIASAGVEFTFRKLPFFNGLGILVPAARMTPALQELIEGFFTPDALLEACMAVEADSMHLRAILTGTETCLTRRTEALERARAVIETQRQRIEQLQQSGNVSVTG